MKGIVFTELLAMAESTLGEEAVDDILDRLSLESGGAYSAVGNYPCGELMRIVGALSAQSGLPVAELQRLFGRYMLQRFTQGYPGFFTDKTDALTMFEAIEDEVHVEVRKLYPDAELPTFATERLSPQSLRLTYRSPRPLSDFCHGLVEACVDHFGVPARIDRQDMPRAGESVAQFTVTLAG